MIPHLEHIIGEGAWKNSRSVLIFCLPDEWVANVSPSLMMTTTECNIRRRSVDERKHNCAARSAKPWEGAHFVFCFVCVLFWANRLEKFTVRVAKLRLEWNSREAFKRNGIVDLSWKCRLHQLLVFRRSPKAPHRWCASEFSSGPIDEANVCSSPVVPSCQRYEDVLGGGNAIGVDSRLTVDVVVFRRLCLHLFCGEEIIVVIPVSNSHPRNIYCI